MQQQTSKPMNRRTAVILLALILLGVAAYLIFSPSGNLPPEQDPTQDTPADTATDPAEDAAVEDETSGQSVPSDDTDDSPADLDSSSSDSDSGRNDQAGSGTGAATESDQPDQESAKVPDQPSSEGNASDSPDQNPSDLDTAPATQPQTTESLASSTKPEVTIAGAKVPLPPIDLNPTLDIVRVDEVGVATIAGTAEPNALVRIRIGDSLFSEQQADAAGEFATIGFIELNGQPLQISLESVSSSGLVRQSSDSVLVLPNAIEPEGGFGRPLVVRTDEQSVSVLQAPKVSEGLQLDSISYDADGEALISGRAGLGNSITVLADGRIVDTVAVDGSGRWTASLRSIEPRLYLLRIIEVNPAGTVIAALETPFKKEVGDLVLDLANSQKSSSEELPAFDGGSLPASLITVQPGYTLWGISRQRYGLGRLFVRIYEANSTKINNPDLIYPGQVFKIP